MGTYLSPEIANFQAKAFPKRSVPGALLQANFLFQSDIGLLSFKPNYLDHVSFVSPNIAEVRITGRYGGVLWEVYVGKRNWTLKYEGLWVSGGYWEMGLCTNADETRDMTGDDPYYNAISVVPSNYDDTLRLVHTGSVVTSTSFAPSTNTWYKFKLERSGDVYTVSEETTGATASATITAPKAGRIGVYCHASDGGTTRLRNVRLKIGDK